MQLLRLFTQKKCILFVLVVILLVYIAQTKLKKHKSKYTAKSKSKSKSRSKKTQPETERVHSSSPFQVESTLSLMKDLKHYVVEPGADKSNYYIIAGCIDMLPKSLKLTRQPLMDFWNQMKQVNSGEVKFEVNMFSKVFSSLSNSSVQDNKGGRKYCNQLEYRSQVKDDKILDILNNGKYFGGFNSEDRSCSKPFVPTAWFNHRNMLPDNAFTLMNIESRKKCRHGQNETMKKTKP